MKIIAILAMAVCLLSGCAQESLTPNVVTSGKIDPIALAKIHVEKHKIDDLDLASGKLIREDAQSWFVSFVYPKSKAAGETPYHRMLKIDKKTGSVTDLRLQ